MSIIQAPTRNSGVDSLSASTTSTPKAFTIRIEVGLIFSCFCHKEPENPIPALQAPYIGLLSFHLLHPFPKP